jgi:bacteriorhodopsin
MAVSTFAFIGMSFRVPRQNRIFHYITASITLVATVAYFTMASNLGYTGISVEYMRSNPQVAGTTREVFYVRYIDWFVTTPVSFTYQVEKFLFLSHYSFFFWTCFLRPVSRGLPFCTLSYLTGS